MGSASDWDTMKPAAKVLEEFGVSYVAMATSAPRTPAAVMAWTGAAKDSGRLRRRIKRSAHTRVNATSPR